jgi:hypothetical protein
LLPPAKESDIKSRIEGQDIITGDLSPREETILNELQQRGYETAKIQKILSEPDNTVRLKHSKQDVTQLANELEQQLLERSNQAQNNANLPRYKQDLSYKEEHSTTANEQPQTVVPEGFNLKEFQVKQKPIVAKGAKQPKVTSKTSLQPQGKTIPPNVVSEPVMETKPTVDPVDIRTVATPDFISLAKFNPKEIGTYIDELKTRVSSAPDEVKLSDTEYLNKLNESGDLDIDYTKKVKLDTGERVTVKKNIVEAFREIRSSLDEYKKLLDCIAKG